MSFQLKRITVPNTEKYDAEKVICQVTGKSFPDHKTLIYFKDVETQHEYTYVVGAFSPPGFDKAGFSVVIGYDRNRDLIDKVRMIRVLAEKEGSRKDFQSMVAGMTGLKNRYGCPPLLSLWFTHLDEFLYIKMADVLDQARSPFYVGPGPYPDKNPIPEYLKTLFEMLHICDLGRCFKLRGYIEKGPQNEREAKSFKQADNPALTAFAIAISALMVGKPWTYEEEMVSMEAYENQSVGSYGSFGDEELLA